MSDAFRTLIVPDCWVQLARDISATLSPVGGAGMYETPLSPAGELPATHWISSGYIGAEYAALLPLFDPETGLTEPGQPDTITAAYNNMTEGDAITVSAVELLVSAVDITEQPPFVALDRLYLQIADMESV